MHDEVDERFAADVQDPYEHDDREKNLVAQKKGSWQDGEESASSIKLLNMTSTPNVETRYRHSSSI